MSTSAPYVTISSLIGLVLGLLSIAIDLDVMSIFYNLDCMSSFNHYCLLGFSLLSWLIRITCYIYGLKYRRNYLIIQQSKNLICVGKFLQLLLLQPLSL